MEILYCFSVLSTRILRFGSLKLLFFIPGPRVNKSKITPPLHFLVYTLILKL